jgi:hypothetical protein
MRGERGQASVEWIGLLLLVALALAALTHFAPRADGHDMASALLKPIKCATRGVACGPAGSDRGGRPPRGAAPAPRRSPTIPVERATVPFLLPEPRGFAPPELRDLRRLIGRPGGSRELARHARRGFVRAWQRAWLACLFYERIRYNLLHPESRIPGHRIPASEILRMLNDCISPVDLVRDWPLLHGQAAGGRGQ